eukprot:499424_1
MSDFYPSSLNNETYNDIFIFLNLFSPSKHSNQSIGEFIGLHDGLDSNPLQTSRDMGELIQMYGRFGSGFDANLWGGLPLNDNVNLYFNVTYFDNNNGVFSFIHIAHIWGKQYLP